MAVTASQYALNNSTAVAIGTLAGGATAYVASVTAAATIYIGTSSSVTASTGFPVATGNPPLAIPVPPASEPVTLYAIGSGSVAAAVLVTTTA